MTDNEIIKALECCNDDACKYCPFCDDDCMQKCRSKAIELINSQKAEIERLKSFENTSHYWYKKAGELIDNIEIAKSEAIKEFVERLKSKIALAIDTYHNSNGGGYYLAEDVIDDIDNLVKEMTEREENK